MQCPNCGRKVRSKTQCAYCGYHFNSADKQEFKQDKIEKQESNVKYEPSSKVGREDRVSRRKAGDSVPKPESTPIQPIPRRSLDKEMAEAEEQAQENYQKVNRASHDQGLDEDESFKQRADEVFAYPYTANQESYQEDYDEEEEYIVPKTKQRSGGSVLATILKLLLAFALIFLLFLFAPRIIGKMKEYFAPNHSSLRQVPEEHQDSPNLAGSEAIEEGAQQEQANDDQDEEVAKENSATDQEAKKKNETSAGEGEKESSNPSSESEGKPEQSDESQLYQVKSSQVNVDDYPTIRVELDFDQELSKVDQNTFDFKVKYNDTEIKLDDEYSLLKEGKKLIISFVDPALSVVGEDTSKQALLIETEGFSDSVAYDVPSKDLDEEKAQELSKIAKENLNEQGDASLFVHVQDEKSPFVYDSKAVEADNLIGWFILQRIYELVADNKVQLDDTVKFNDQLLASGDFGTVATSDATEYTVQELIDLTIQQGDASAMNHLVQLAEGVNQFNYWLKESGYFTTRMNAPLAVEGENYISGAMTNATDIGQLLEKLANNQLIDKERDEMFKEALLQSPMSEKFPAENELVERRFELLTSDANTNVQHYSGIIETSEKPIIYVIMSDELEDPASMNTAIQQTISQSLDYIVEGQTTEDREQSEDESREEEANAEAESRAQAEAESRAEAEAQSREESNREASQVTLVDNETTAEISPSGENISNLYEGKQTDNYYWFGDEYRRGTWYQDENGKWSYY
ncbi:serine hydrolase [Facklamia sp. DSM 111018]|uniref:Serine hydrolase n=1 Tax=Facklamia lactis TaxID=2749967 RepID=A0ABS0LU49_9LACT|nr:serine hydrolase [Facklamia lactis]MBG9980813.1 serine hydrolase [Facklamia lactis]MBG9986824.1 serine hydrolase [Facklamia lactis]